jgi:hypothetical protein
MEDVRYVKTTHTFKNIKGEDLHLDVLCSPEPQAQKKPTILFFHGGYVVCFYLLQEYEQTSKGRFTKDKRFRSQGIAMDTLDGYRRKPSAEAGHSFRLITGVFPNQRATKSL